MTYNAHPTPDTVLAGFDINDLRHALKTNEELFIQFNLGDTLTFPVPDFHKIGFKHLCNETVSRIALAWPRDHAKTTIAKLAAVWYFAFSAIKFVVYVSNTAPLAKLACTDIVNFMKAENFVAVFGTIQWITQSVTEGLYVFILNGKKKILKAQGAGMQIRGMNIDNTRPELAIVDDLEDNENTETPHQREKLKLWVYGPFLKAMNKSWNKVIWLGNMLSSQSLLYDICKDQDWASLRFGCLVEGEDGQLVPLWPDRFPMADIIKDFNMHQSKNILALWFAEMMNLPLPGGSGLIKPDDIPYAPAVMPMHYKTGFITIDPAISRKAWANYTCLAVHILVPENQHWQIAEVVKVRVDPVVLYSLATGLARKWGLRLIGIEDIAFQASLQFFFPMMAAARGDHDIKIVPLKGNPNGKTMRLAGWAAMLKSKQYRLTEGEMLVTEQLLTYNPLKDDNDDDVIDACGYGPQMLEQFMGEIMKQYEALSPTTVKSCYQIAAI